MANKSFFEELESRAGQLSEKAMLVGAQLSGLAKNKTEQLIAENDIRSAEKKLKGLYSELGKLCYDEMKEAVDNTAEKELLVEQIDALSEEINGKKEAVEKITKRIACPKCGKYAEEGETVCPKCGKVFGEDDVEEAEEAAEEVAEAAEEAAEEVAEAVEEAAEEVAEAVEEAAEEAAEAVETPAE